MPLSDKHRRHLRGLAHDLKPCVLVGGAGVTPGLLAEVDQQLEHHELIKVKLRVGDRDQRAEAIAALGRESRASLVTRIGNVAVLYRPRRDKPGIRLP
jgi:RNA-binding protein